jgi:DHA1 family bicyclomycin/chloramphenicol resistance-like MFS transporter
MGLTFVGTFGLGSFFVFIASASFVYTEHFGLSPTAFSLLFALNALGYFAASQAAAPLGQRFGHPRDRLALVGFAALTLLLLAIAWAGLAARTILVGFLFAANAFLGLVPAPRARPRGTTW